MPGNWETPDHPYVIIGMLVQQYAPSDMIMAAMRLERPGWRVVTQFEHDLPWDLSRNLVASTVLKSGAEWCFFWDSDIVVPPYALTRLVSRQQPIVSGLYYRRHPDIFPEVFRYNVGAKMFEPMPRPVIEDQVRAIGGLIPVDGVGAGCLLIHRKVFERLKEKVPHREVVLVGPPTTKADYWEFFKYGIGNPEMSGAGEGFSEDLVFCKRARDAGFRVILDWTVSCTHITKMGVAEGKVDWAPVESGRG